MRWTKLKKQLESFLAPSLKGKINYNYGIKGDNGILSITFNNKPIVTFHDDWFGYRKVYKKLENQYPTWSRQQINSYIDKMGKSSEYEFCKATEIYLKQNIKESLNSNNKLVMALAMLDRRVGKRTLQKLSYLYFTHTNDIVIEMYNLRFEVEFGNNNTHKNQIPWRGLWALN